MLGHFACLHAVPPLCLGLLFAGVVDRIARVRGREIEWSAGLVCVLTVLFGGWAGGLAGISFGIDDPFTAAPVEQYVFTPYEIAVNAIAFSLTAQWVGVVLGLLASAVTVPLMPLPPCSVSVIGAGRGVELAMFPLATKIVFPASE